MYVYEYKYTHDNVNTVISHLGGNASYMLMTASLLRVSALHRSWLVMQNTSASCGPFLCKVR